MEGKDADGALSTRFVPEGHTGNTRSISAGTSEKVLFRRRSPTRRYKGRAINLRASERKR